MPALTAGEAPSCVRALMCFLVAMLVLVPRVESQQRAALPSNTTIILWYDAPDESLENLRQWIALFRNAITIEIESHSDILQHASSLDFKYTKSKPRSLQYLEDDWKQRRAIQVFSANGANEGGGTSVTTRIYMGDYQGHLPKKWIAVVEVIRPDNYKITRSFLSATVLYALAIDAGAKLESQVACVLLHDAKTTIKGLKLATHTALRELDSAIDLSQSDNKCLVGK